MASQKPVAPSEVLPIRPGETIPSAGFEAPGGGPRECPECGRIFQTMWSYRVHLKEQHGH